MIRWLALAIALAVAAPSAAFAQPGAGAGQRKQRPNKRDKVKERIRAMRAWVLTEQLDLDAATAEKMFPVLARYDDDLAKLLGERKQLRAQLTTARRAGNRAAIDGLLDKLVANQRARWAAEEQRFADLRTMLTAEQAADLLDLLPEVDRKILRGLRDAIDQGAAATPGEVERGPRTGGDELSNPFDTRK